MSLKNFDEALKCFKPLAIKGNAQAQFRVGFLYSAGLGTKQDTKIALEWFRKSANAGNPSSQNNLGYYYEYGMGGLLPDFSESIKWYEKAAQQRKSGVPAYRIGQMYEFGKGVPVDKTKAIIFYKDAVELGPIHTRSLAQERLNTLQK